MKKSLTIWVVIPGFNEEKYLSQVLKKVRQQTPNIIFVDDGSSDKTAQIAAQHLKHVLAHSVNLGKGAAMKTGCDYAFDVLKADAVIFMDSDDQHDPHELQAFQEKLNQGSPVVFGVRSFDRTMPLSKIMRNRLASVVIYYLFSAYIPDIPCGYKALTRDAYKHLRWQATDYAVEMEIAARVAKYRLPFAVVDVKTIYHDLEKGMTLFDNVRIISRLLAWKFSL